MRRKAFQEASALQRKMKALIHTEMFLEWDRAMDPPKTIERLRAQAYALAEVQMVPYSLLKGSEGQRLAKVFLETQTPEEQLEPLEEANIREFLVRTDKMKRVLQKIDSKSLAGAARHSWSACRAKNDWKQFKHYLGPVIEEKRYHGQQLATRRLIEAKDKASATGGKRGEKSLPPAVPFTPYDGLLDDYTLGLRQQTVSKVLTHLQGWLPSLVKEVVEKQKHERLPPKAIGPFKVEKQIKIAKEVLTSFGFDFQQRGRLDCSPQHPYPEHFPVGGRDDVRIVVPFVPGHYLRAVNSSLNVGGKALYSQNIPSGDPALDDQFLQTVRSSDVSEAQGYIFAHHIGRSMGFAQYIEPLLHEQFGSVPENKELLSAKSVQQRVTRVVPGMLMLDADELTQPLHLMLRTEIESAVINGDMEIDELPTAWDYKMKEYLGVDTREQFSNTVMQDIHWPSGMMGYFPSQLVAHVYAAQLMAAMKKDLGEGHVEGCLSQGVATPISDWLKRKVWSRGSIPANSEELLIEATGEPLNPDYYREHLTQRYLLSSPSS